MGTAEVFPYHPSPAPLRPPPNAISERGGRMGFARPERRKERRREGDGGASKEEFYESTWEVWREPSHITLI